MTSQGIFQLSLQCPLWRNTLPQSNLSPYFLLIQLRHNKRRRWAFCNLNYGLIHLCKAHNAASVVLTLIKWFPLCSVRSLKSLLAISSSWAHPFDHELHTYSHNIEVEVAAPHIIAAICFCKTFFISFWPSSMCQLIMSALNIMMI